MRTGEGVAVMMHLAEQDCPGVAKPAAREPIRVADLATAFDERRPAA